MLVGKEHDVTYYYQSMHDDQYSINRLTNRTTHILSSAFDEVLECWSAAGTIRLLASDVVCFRSAVPKVSIG